jgi:hypothetical protein
MGEYEGGIVGGSRIVKGCLYGSGAGGCSHVSRARTARVQSGATFPIWGARVTVPRPVPEADCFLPTAVQADFVVVQGRRPPDDSGPRGPKERR